MDIFDKCNNIIITDEMVDIKSWMTDEDIGEFLKILIEEENMGENMYLLTEETTNGVGGYYTINIGCSEDEVKIMNVKADLEEKELLRRQEVEFCMDKVSKGTCIYCKDRKKTRITHKYYYVKEVKRI